MVRSLISLIFCLLLSNSTLARLDSLVKYDEIFFRNSFERHVFAKSGSENPGLFEGFMVFSSYEIQRINEYRASLEQKILTFKNSKRPKNNSKYLKKVYEFVHDGFLRKYENEAYFHQIFEMGKYNCVTAVALYGITFNKLDIPYVIKETPTHVYIIAYPESEQIGIETTDPIGGFKTFSVGFKQNFVNQLVGLKLIDIAELSEGINTVFDRYYFSAKEITLKELIGLQYYNYGLSQLKENNYLEAFQNLQKAHYLYPSDQVREVLSTAGLASLSEANYSSWEDVNLLMSAIRLDHQSFTDQHKFGEFARLLDRQLINDNDTTMIDSAYHVIVSQELNSDLKEEISFYYYYERGRKLYNRGNYLLALPYSELAYQIKPHNSDSENLLVSNIQNSIATNVYSYDQALDIVERLLHDHPELSTHGHLGEIRSNLFLEAIYDSFESKEATEAMQYKTQFESFIKEFNYRYDKYTLGRAYSQGIMYYFRKGALRNARSLLNDGLRLDPENQDLKLRKYYLDRATN